MATDTPDAATTPVNTAAPVAAPAVPDPNTAVPTMPAAPNMPPNPPSNIAPTTNPADVPRAITARQAGWQNFRRGMASTTPQYTADANGNLTQTNKAPITKGGILGAILGGALQAVSAAASAQAPEGAKGYGAAMSAGAQSEYEKRLGEDNRARQIAQANLVNQQAVTKAKMENGLRAMQTAQVNQQMQHDDVRLKEEMKKAGIEDESAQDQIIKNRQDFQNTIGDTLAWAAANGGPAPIDTIGHETGAAHQLHGQAVPHVKAIMQNKVTLMPNGKTGKENSMLAFSTDDLSKPVPVGTPDLIMKQYTGTINSDGSLPQTETVVRADGKLTYGDVFAKLHGQMTMQKDLQQRYITSITAKSKANLENAQANMANEQAKQMKDMGGTAMPPGFVLSAAARSMSQADLQQTLAAQGVQAPSDFSELYAIGHFQDPLSILPQKLFKGMAGRTQEQAANFIHNFINPGFSAITAPAIMKQVQEYASTRPNTAGGNVLAYNTAVAHLGRMVDAATALKNHDVRALNAITNYYHLQTGAPAVTIFNTIHDALVGEVAKTYVGGKPDVGTMADVKASFNSSASPDQMLGYARNTAGLMQSKNAELATHYYNWTGHLNPDAVTDETVKVYNKLGVDPYAGLPQGAQAAPGATGNMNPTQVPTGVTPIPNPPARPATVGPHYIYGSGPNGLGWYDPTRIPVQK